MRFVIHVPSGNIYKCFSVQSVNMFLLKYIKQVISNNRVLVYFCFRIFNGRQVNMTNKIQHKPLKQPTHTELLHNV